ncbi:uncharacterized protein B0J16DRAFT_312734 [Fusarium flagelliforme]|nr:uncharacterized protein B0J16DRAFT_312734 [Fusarium flagelliforme]KAH7196369.1 hypothetical protein B0J16DRAFT_312734 [Fusarium flagelliforme]
MSFHGFSDSCLLDLELMYHYTTKTCMTPPHVLDQSVFRDEVPRVALRYPYLMHQLLALSAFHCAYLQPDSRQRYVLHGSEHQTQAIVGMRSALERRIAEEISFALFMTSAMLMTGSFASHLKYQHSEPLSPLAGLLEIMTLTRGLSAIRTTALAELRFNVLDKLKQNDCSQPDCKTNDVLKTQLSILQSRLSSLTDVDDAAKAVVKAGAQSILDCMDTTKTPGTSMSSEIHLIFTWLTRLSGDFFSLLQAQHPGSLVVLLYYVVALQEAESQCWILEGWSAQLTISIAGLLTAPWTELAQWAMDELRHSQGTTS